MCVGGGTVKSKELSKFFHFENDVATRIIDIYGFTNNSGLILHMYNNTGKISSINLKIFKKKEENNCFFVLLLFVQLYDCTKNQNAHDIMCVQGREGKSNKSQL